MNAAHVDVRAFAPGDEPGLHALAGRLVAGVAPWRPGHAVAGAVARWVAQSIAAAQEGQGAVLVAETGGQLAGFASIANHKHWTGETDGYLGELAVDPHFEGRGVGSALVAAAERWCVDAGYRRITLQTGAANEHAIGFYRRRGYLPEEVQLTKLL